MISITELSRKIGLNETSEKKLQNDLNEVVDKLNDFIGKNEIPAPEVMEDLDKAVKALRPTVQWLSALREVVKYAEAKNLKAVSDEDITIALTKARKYTAYVVKTNKTTDRYEKVTKAAKYDMLGMLEKLDVNLGSFKQKMSVILCSIALLADRRITKGKGKAAIIANYRGDADIKKAITEAKEIGSLSFLKDAVQNAVNAYIPSSKFTAAEPDAEFFYAISTKLDKKKICGVSAGLAKEAYEGFFDYASELLNKDGKVRYNIAYKYTELEAKEYVTAEDEDENSESAKPQSEEMPNAKEPAVETPAAEPVAAKPAKEPTAKRGSKGSKKSDKAAA